MINDPHSYTKRYFTMIKKVENSDFSDVNKKLLIKFIRACKRNQINEGFIEITLTRNNEEYTNQIDVDTTKCNYGGERYWLLCPGCSRRVGVLFCGIYDLKLLCRHCRNLAYESSNCHRSHSYETIIRHRRIVEKLEPIFTKKGVHMKTLLKIAPKYMNSKIKYDRNLMLAKFQLGLSMVRYYERENPEEMFEKFKKMGLIKDDE